MAVLVSAPLQRVRHAIRAFPVLVERADGGAARVRGLPAAVVAAMVRHLGAHAWTDEGAAE
eukprot:6779354-Alexandrium_andersonii.AAC.1